MKIKIKKGEKNKKFHKQKTYKKTNFSILKIKNR